MGSRSFYIKSVLLPAARDVEENQLLTVLYIYTVNIYLT